MKNKFKYQIAYLDRALKADYLPEEYSVLENSHDLLYIKGKTAGFGIGDLLILLVVIAILIGYATKSFEPVSFIGLSLLALITIYAFIIYPKRLKKTFFEI
jgi:hypothetical protein